MYNDTVSTAIDRLSNNTIKGRIQELSVDVLKQTVSASKRSGNRISELDEITDLGNDAQFTLFVRYHATEDYVAQFLFCRPLGKHTTRKEMLKKLIPLRNISFCGLTACLFVPMVIPPRREPKRFFEFMKQENKSI